MRFSFPSSFLFHLLILSKTTDQVDEHSSRGHRGQQSKAKNIRADMDNHPSFPGGPCFLYLPLHHRGGKRFAEHILTLLDFFSRFLRRKLLYMKVSI